MSTSTILVIDDSATIRKMVDSHLSQEGYRVVLAQNGEIGIEMAREIKPDLILLDHQLPGTTGLEVCRKIVQFPECRHIPFVVSSTLRKQAYSEYMDVPNVVDSLPKPFTPNLLKMAVANALETGAMIIASQTNGTAVPEVVGETDQPALSGDFRWVGLREVLDFLNNGRKSGMLEVETDRNRVCFFLKDGRIQGVVSPSFDPAQIAAQLPQNLNELSPLLQFTLSSGTSTRVDGLVELMDKKVLDPRLLRTLLRHQAAALTRYCFTSKPTCFSFHPRKLLSTGEGGAITTERDDWAEWLRVKLAHGASGTKGLGLDFVEYGYNFRLPELQAIMGRVQLRRLDAILKRRQAVRDAYIEKLAPLGFIAQYVGSNVEYNVQSLVFRVPEIMQRDRLVLGLKAMGVEATLGTYCMSGTTFFSDRYGDVQPTAAMLEATTVTLPCYDDVPVDRVVDAIIRLIN